MRSFYGEGMGVGGGVGGFCSVNFISIINPNNAIEFNSSLILKPKSNNILLLKGHQFNSKGVQKSEYDLL